MVIKHLITTYGKLKCFSFQLSLNKTLISYLSPCCTFLEARSAHELCMSLMRVNMSVNTVPYAIVFILLHFIYLFSVHFHLTFQFMFYWLKVEENGWSDFII